MFRHRVLPCGNGTAYTMGSANNEISSNYLDHVDPSNLKLRVDTMDGRNTMPIAQRAGAREGRYA